MKTIFKQTTTFILTLVLAVAAFAAPVKNSGAKEFQNAATFSANTFQNGGVPAAVLDTNFRWWQPSNPVALVPCNINDIMMTDGKTICFNPDIVSQVPLKIRAFFLAHEYGHIYGKTSDEFQSDQFAARVYAQTDMSVVKAAIWHFANIQGNMCNASHGCGWQRALNIGQTAGFTRAEVENIVRGNL